MDWIIHVTFFSCVGEATYYLKVTVEIWKETFYNNCTVWTVQHSMSLNTVWSCFMLTPGHKKNLCWHSDTPTNTTLTPFSLLTFLRVPQVCFPRIFFKHHRRLFPSLEYLGGLESWTPLLLGIEMFLSHADTGSRWPLLICMLFTVLSWSGLRCVHCPLLT